MCMDIDPKGKKATMSETTDQVKYLFRVFFLELKQFFRLLIHLILQSIFFSIQSGDGPLQSRQVLFVPGAVPTQLP